MHIVLANQWYPPESGWGGVARYNHTIAHAYHKLGHSVTVIASRTSLSTPALKDDSGISVRRLMVSDAYRWRRLPILGRYVRPVQQLAYSRCVNAALRDLNREQPIDVVEFAEVNAEGFFYAHNPIAPFVVHCHMPTFVLRKFYASREMPFDTRIIGECERYLIRRASALTAPSSDMATVIANECGMPIKSITAIPNALSSDEWQPTNQLPGHSAIRPSEYINILHVGRIERAKGVVILAEAIPRVVSQVSNVRFVFIGDDRRAANSTSQRVELETNLSMAGMSSNVEFLGIIFPPKLGDWYNRADICVVPSLLPESFSYTCAQAMAAGKPVVATRIGGIPETVDENVCGLIVEPGNVEQLANAIVQLARDPDMRARMGKAGQEKAKREFDPTKIAQRNLEVYERAIQAFKH
jgi:glycogen synthase